MSLCIATWNVNSIRVRLDAVLAWLESRRPDVLCLQETKVTDADFPAAAFAAHGYEVTSLGQKGYNGVAIAARSPLLEVQGGFDIAALDAEGARLLHARTAGTHVYSAYVPNGKIVNSPAYAMKLLWLDALAALLQTRHGRDAPLAVCGDFNIAAEDRDVHDPRFWRAQVLFHPSAREALQRFCGIGLVDTFRLHHQEGGAYSWWDYRQGALAKNEGLRIDYVFASQALASRCTSAAIDKEPRQQPNPSDHTPVLAVFDTEGRS
jgi:exodeoxyribonuclease-3